MNSIYIKYCLLISISGLLFLASCNKSTPHLSFSPATTIARVTGASPDNEIYPNPNDTDTKYNVGGTDLGIVWEMEESRFGIFLGDTYGRYHFEEPIKKESDWRCNVLAFSNDTNLTDGLSFTSMVTDSLGDAREIIYGAKDKSGQGDWTSIPTAAIRANGKDYVHYMNVKHWNSSNWGTNYSALYSSSDSGQTWIKSDRVLFSEDSNFGQVGYWKKDNYIYMIGTESGRQSSPRLARFEERNIENQAEYEFWNGIEKTWIKTNEEKATNLFDDTVGELSFIYHKKTGMWILAYFNETSYDIVFRYAKDISGPWSDVQSVANGKQFPQLYGSYIHPLSVDSNDIYFLMSLWEPYNVFLMKTQISIINQ